MFAAYIALCHLSVSSVKLFVAVFSSRIRPETDFPGKVANRQKRTGLHKAD
jgi:hypothetical protein